MIELYESNPEGEAEKSRIIAFADSKLREIEEQIMQLQMLREDILTYKAKYENSRVKT